MLQQGLAVLTLAAEVSIKATGLGKSYSLTGSRRSRDSLFWAVRDLTFTVESGQVLGIIGRNGSGKSTLLKLLCQVSAPSAGEAEVSGRVTAMLGVGTGMHPMFTGRENLYFSGQILGLDYDYIHSRIDSIIEFSEVGQFIDRPIKTYSSGMRARLGFAIAAQLDPEILLLDEVLAVGDVGFQQKCLQRIREMRSSGSTILLVTHNMNVVKSFCDSALLLDEGRIVRQGDPDDVVNHYLAEIMQQESQDEGSGEGTRAGNGTLRVEGFHFEDANGAPLDVLASGESVTLCLDYVCADAEGATNVSVGVAFADDNGRWLFRTATNTSGNDIPRCPNVGTLRCAFQSLPLAPGRYRFGYRITCDNEVADYIVDFGSFDVVFGDFFGTGELDEHSPAYVRHRWEISEEESPDLVGEHSGN